MHAPFAIKRFVSPANLPVTVKSLTAKLVAHTPAIVAIAKCAAYIRIESANTATVSSAMNATRSAHHATHMNAGDAPLAHNAIRLIAEEK